MSQGGTYSVFRILKCRANIPYSRFGICIGPKKILRGPKICSDARSGTFRKNQPKLSKFLDEFLFGMIFEKIIQIRATNPNEYAKLLADGFM